MSKITVRTKAAAGFTLVELLIVLAVLGLISTAVLTKWSTNPSRYDAIAEQLRRDLRYTQALAMAKNVRYRVNLLSTSYWISDNSGNAIAHPAVGTARVNLPGDILLTWNSVLMPNNYIAFDGKGIPHADASSTSSTQAIVVTNASASYVRVLSVSADTGVVSSRLSG